MDEVTNGLGVAAAAATAAALTLDPERRTIVRASNRWVNGGYTRSQLSGGSYPADLPPALGGGGLGPSPTELLLHALASCLSASVVLAATARGAALVQVETDVEALVDLRPALAEPSGDGAGIESVWVNCRVHAEAAPDALTRLLEDACRRSLVLAALSAGVRVHLDHEVITP
ncbi:MAG: OsmC family protein [Acidimicrobiales bacterium]